MDDSTFGIILFLSITLIPIIFLIILIVMIIKPRFCPKCKKKLPIFRQPTSLDQMLLGGWTCPNCGSELDRKGNLINKEKRVYREEYIKEKARLQAQKEFNQHKEK